MTEKNTQSIKCMKCRKKIGILEEAYCKCKCDLIFCPKHRLASEHDCKFDYIEENKNKFLIMEKVKDIKVDII